MSNITFKQYRNIDLGIFSVLLIISESVTTLATNSWFAEQPIAISTTLLFICMVMMRWNLFALLPAMLGGIVFCVASGASAEQYLIYIVGNCAALLSMLWFKAFGKDGIRKSSFKTFLFVACAYLSMQVGRWLISLFFGADLRTLLVYLGTDIISLLFAVVLILLMKNTDGMFEDQKAYLFRLQREREAQQMQPPALEYDD
ncbi:MAG: hypothetical protein J6V80_07505 [Clostridia bacterium]|nr:hypothetical protein [Clostridia bacterium]